MFFFNYFALLSSFLRGSNLGVKFGGSNLGVKFGSRIWESNLGVKFGGQIWGSNLEVKFGSQIWELNLKKCARMLYFPLLNFYFFFPQLTCFSLHRTTKEFLAFIKATVHAFVISITCALFNVD